MGGERGGEGRGRQEISGAKGRRGKRRGKVRRMVRKEKDEEEDNKRRGGNSLAPMLKFGFLDLKN